MAPLYAGPGAGVVPSDFKLRSNSPLINAGLDVLDLNKNGSTSDRITIGAYITGNEIIGRIP